MDLLTAQLKQAAQTTDTLLAFLADREQQLSHCLRSTDSKLRTRLDMACMAHMLCLLLLPSTEDDDDNHERHNDMIMDDTIQSSMPLIVSSLNKIVSVLLRRLFEAPQAESLALVSLLSGLCVGRPSVLPTCLPALVSRYEQLLGGSGNTVHGNASLVHALRNALASIMSSPAAEPYYPLLMDALSKAQKGSTATSRKRILPDDDHLHQSTTTTTTDNSGSLQQATATEPPRLDIMRIPLDMVIDLMIASLQYVDSSSDPLLSVMERWRPSKSTVVASTTDTATIAMERADPRRRTEEPVHVEEHNEHTTTTTSNNNNDDDENVAENENDTLKHIIMDNLIIKGCSVARRFNRHGYHGFLGRLLCHLDAFTSDIGGVDLYDDLCDAVFPDPSNPSHSTSVTSSSSAVEDGCKVIADYLSSLYFTTDNHQQHHEKMVKAMLMVPVQHLPRLCLGLPVIDYETLVPVLRQHLLPSAMCDHCVSGDDNNMVDDNNEESMQEHGKATMQEHGKVDPKTAQLVMSLIGDLRSSRPLDEWSILRDFLVQLCRHPDVLLRTMAVEQGGVRFLTASDARSILYADDNDTTTTTAVMTTDGQRLDLCMAMAVRCPELIVDLLQTDATNPYLQSRLSVIMPVLQAQSVESELAQVYRDTHQTFNDFWCRLLSLKSAVVSQSFGRVLFECFIDRPDPKLLLSSVLFDKAPKQSLSQLDDPSSFLKAALSVVDMNNNAHVHVQRLLEYVAGSIGADLCLLAILSLDQSDSAMAACQTALSMSTVFKAAVWLQALTRLFQTPRAVGTLAMRAALLALTLHKSALYQPYLAMLQNHVDGLIGREDLLRVLLKQIKVCLPHSLHLFNGLPVQVQREALRPDGEVDLRKPIKEYLYGLPPSVRSRYQQLMRLLE